MTEVAYRPETYLKVSHMTSGQAGDCMETFEVAMVNLVPPINARLTCRA